jgi:hypothetical protein
MKPKSLLLALAGIFFLIGGTTQAQNCSTDKAHEFDFWIGEWEVEADGSVVGTNSIKPILDGCVIQEKWAGASGSAGSSLNYFDPQKEQWEQFWVWRAGSTLYTKGHFADGKMVLVGESLNQKGETITNRITWHDNEDGTVRQVWEISTDDQETWSNAFDGLYTRKK